MGGMSSRTKRTTIVVVDHRNMVRTAAASGDVNFCINADRGAPALSELSDKTWDAFLWNSLPHSTRNKPQANHHRVHRMV
jgi:hypothetical protein